MALPIPIKIVGDGWFHTGWACGVLGLPKQEFYDEDNPVTDMDVDAYHEGYDMGQETPNDIRHVFQAMIQAGQLKVW